MTGKTPQTSNPANWDGGDIPFVTPGDLNGGLVSRSGRRITSEGLKYYKALTPGAVLVGCIGNIGKVGLANAPVMVTNQQINALVPDRQRADGQFVLYAFIHAEHRLREAASQTTVPILNKSNFGSFKLAVPPLPEQRAIATTLSTVQEARNARRRELELERERKAALMEELFTRGVRGEPLKETEIGRMPRGWRVVRIGDVSTDLGSGITPRGGEKTYLRDGIPLIRSQNVLMNKLRLEEVAYISKKTHAAMSRSATRPGDILLNITGASIGRVACVPSTLEMANVNQHVCRIRLAHDADPLFISYFLGFREGQSQIMGTQFGTTRQGLNYGQVRALSIPLPAVQEQRKIADVLTTCNNKIAALETEANLLDELFRALLDDLMTGRVSAVALLDK